MTATRYDRPSYDVVVVGARAAGASTALLLARRGARVLVVDRTRRGSDTLSTHALMRPAVVQLHRWGLLDDLFAAGTPPITRTTFHYGHDQVPISLRPVAGTAALAAPRRTVLDPLLLDAAEAAGADVLTGVRVNSLLRDGTGRVTGVELDGGRQVSAGTVVGADGYRSLVAEQVGAQERPLGRHAGSCVYGYVDRRVADGYEWFYGTGLTSGLIPTNDDQTLVFVSRPAGRPVPGGWAELYQDVATAWPAGEAMLAGARPTVRLRRFQGSPAYARRPWGAGWALVGDAGCYVDPLSSHGISQALRDAELLVDALTAAGPAGFAMAGYERRRDELTGPVAAAVDDIASFAWTPSSVRELVMRMSSAMSAEVDALTAMGAPPDGSAGAGAERVAVPA